MYSTSGAKKTSFILKLQVKIEVRLNDTAYRQFMGSMHKVESLRGERVVSQPSV